MATPRGVWERKQDLESSTDPTPPPPFPFPLVPPSMKSLFLYQDKLENAGAVDTLEQYRIGGMKDKPLVLLSLIFNG